MWMCLWAIQITRWKTLSLTSTKKSQTPVCLLPITSLFLISNATAFQQIFQTVKTRKENKCSYTMPLNFVNFTWSFLKNRNGRASNLFRDHRSKASSMFIFYLTINMRRFSKLEKNKKKKREKKKSCFYLLRKLHISEIFACRSRIGA